MPNRSLYRWLPFNSLFHVCFSHPFCRPTVKVVLDGLVGILAWGIARTFIGTPFSDHGKGWVWGGACLLVSLSLASWRHHYRFFGFRDALRLALATCLLALLGLSFTPMGWSTPSTVLLASLLTGAFWSSVRSLYRWLDEKSNPLQHPENGLRTLIVGAGRAGRLVAEECLRHPELQTEIVGFVDDDLTKQGLRIQGIPVLSTQHLLPTIAKENHIQRVILAIPSASGSEMRALAERVQGLGIECKTAPGLYNLLGNREWKPELRDVSIEDLLRREPIIIDQQELEHILHGETVLVTGAGGSIGSELARQLCRFHPGHLVLLGRGENSLWAIERELHQHYPDQKMSLALCDIRNEKRLNTVFDRHMPSVVFHAAAHKHVPILEQHPEEAIENNIFGTHHVLEAALRIGVRHFINISTDKAVNPTNILGVSKRIAELIVAEAASRAPGNSCYASVRFGNVLGSRGSVVPIFREQISKGGPITITHPEMTRYFMTIPEASQLVIQAGLLGDTGKVYVLDMGEPVRIVDLATDMIKLSGLALNEDIQIAFTGIRPGEKLFEELFHGHTAPKPSNVHPKVFEARIAATTFETEKALGTLHSALDNYQINGKLIDIFKGFVPTYQPFQHLNKEPIVSIN